MAFEEIRSGNVENIMLWRESLSVMPDSHFFDLLRMYLGEIKTPYNKQNLIENLSGVLRKEENKQTIISLLSKGDLELLAAIHLIPKVTQKKLMEFFPKKSFSELYEQLMNLEERLLIFRYIDKETGKTQFKITPFLVETLKPYLTKEKIISFSAEFSQENVEEKEAILTPEVIAAFVAFVIENPDLVKADGNFKKKIDAQLKEIFPRYTNMEFFKLMLESFINLSIFRQTDEGIFVIFNRLETFAKLSPQEQYVYLAVGAMGHFPRDMIQKQSQLFLELLMHSEGVCYTKENIIKENYLINEQKALLGENSVKSGRFAAILREAQNQKENTFPQEDTSSFSINKLIEIALIFGLLYAVRIPQKVETYYIPRKIKETTESKNLNIDGGYSVSVLPGLSLLKLLPFAKSLEVVKLDTILQMEISKKSVLRSFSFGETPESLMFYFSSLSNYDFPQNLKFSIEDWFESYNSGNLYFGYVLKIQPEKAALVERNPMMEPYIKLTLAPGVFLLDFSSNGEAQRVIEEAGLDFIGNVKKLKEEVSSIPFPTIKARGYFTSVKREPSVSGKSLEEITSVKEKFFALINNANFSKEEEEELKSRVSRGIIINQNQLKNVSIHPEKNEAFGMDYLGKIRVIEHAQNSENFVEITYDDVVYFGLPNKIEKTAGDSIVSIILEPSKEEKQFSLGHAQKIKRIRGAIFKDKVR